MALSDKNIVITPNIGSSSDPKIVFSGADSSTSAQNITLNVYPTNSGTLSFEGSAGQLFGISNTMSGTIYSVNDVSGVPSIEVLDTGLVKLNQYNGDTNIGGTVGSAGNRLTLRGYSNSWDGSTPGATTKGTLHFDTYGATGSTDGSAITFSAKDTTNPVQAGIYVTSSGSFGTRMMLATTDSYSTGPRVALYINESGTLYTQRSFLQASGSLRAPIFYDSNDTGYYCDPTSYSQLSYGNFNASPNGRTLSLGGDQRDRVYDDSARASLVINATYYPHLYINATSNASNTTHGPVFSMTGVLSGGGYRRWGMGIANTDPDCFSWGYYDNNTNPHYGVGGNFGYTGTNSKMWLNTSGSLMTTGDMRAPIFYDSNDTGYYIDPASTSVLNVISNPALSDTKLYLRTKGDTNHYLWNADDDWEELVAYNGTGFRVVSSSGAGGLLYCYSAANGNYVLAPTSFRAPIFYDSDNTGYYLDPNSTSNVYNITASNYIRASSYLQSGGNVYIDNNYGYGVVGVYSSYRYQGVFAMGDSYKLAADGTGTGTLYGLAWSHPNAGGVAANLNTHGLLAMENGGWLASLSGSTRSRDDMRAPIFYDNNDTGYYANPNGTSQFSRVNANDIFYGNGSWSYFTGFYDTNDTGYYCDPNSTSRLNTTNINYMSVYGSSYFYGSGNTGSSSSPALMAYSSDGGGAFMSFHRGGYYAVNMGLDNDNVLRIGGWSASANRFQMDMSGNLTMAGNVTAYSDIRLKENIEVITDALNKVKQIRGVTFTRNDQDDKTKRHAGIIAQEVESVLPEVVTEDNMGIKNVAYGNMVGLLIEAIKEQQSEIDELKALVKQLLAR